MADLDPVADSLERVLRNLGSDKSRRAYSEDWQRFTGWLKTQKLAVTEVRPRHVEDHIAGMQKSGRKRSTCGRALSVIRSVYAVLVRDEIVEVNPARELKTPKFDHAPKTPYLTETEVQKLFDLPAETWKERRARVCLSLLFGLGWRRSEVARMRVEDFRQGTVTGILKGNKTVTVGVPKWVQTELEGWCSYAGIEDGPVLPRSRTNREAVSSNIVYQIVAEAAKAAGVEINPHGLRRTAITIEGLRGVSLKERQLAVGHSSQATTERYDKANDAAVNAPGQVLADLVKPASWKTKT